MLRYVPNGSMGFAAYLGKGDEMPKRNPTLGALVQTLDDEGARYFLVHEAGALAIGVSYTSFLQIVDLCLVRGSFPVSDAVVHEQFVEGTVRDILVRVWSKAALGLGRDVRVVRSSLYGCDVLAPDLLLDRMEASPDAEMLVETTALLAAILHVDELTDEDLAMVRRYVRGL